jgi:hypothetical protein
MGMEGRRISAPLDPRETSSLRFVRFALEFFTGPGTATRLATTGGSLCWLVFRTRLGNAAWDEVDARVDRRRRCSSALLLVCLGPVMFTFGGLHPPPSSAMVNWPVARSQLQLEINHTDNAIRFDPVQPCVLTLIRSIYLPVLDKVIRSLPITLDTC